jgi:hypothetical protein
MEINACHIRRRTRMFVTPMLMPMLLLLLLLL